MTNRKIVLSIELILRATNRDEMLNEFKRLANELTLDLDGYHVRIIRLGHSECLEFYPFVEEDNES
jgi:hypothetical protein